MAGIGSYEEVGDFNEGNLCAVVCPKSRLKGISDLGVGHVLVEAGGNALSTIILRKGIWEIFQYLKFG